jgi:hypothetical protein
LHTLAHPSRTLSHALARTCAGPSLGYQLPRCTWDRFGYDIQGDADDCIVVEVDAPEKSHRYLIGMKGAAIKQIQSRAGAYVFFPNTKNAPLRSAACL